RSRRRRSARSPLVVPLAVPLPVPLVTPLSDRPPLPALIMESAARHPVCRAANTMINMQRQGGLRWWAAADEARLGLVRPGELLPLDLLATFTEHAPGVLREAVDARGGDTGGTGLEIDGLRRGDVPLLAPDGGDAVVDLRAPDGHCDRAGGPRGVDEDAVRGVVAELQVQGRVEDRRLDHRRVPAVPVGVRLVLDVLQAGVVRRVE